MCYKIVYDNLYLNTESHIFNIRITFFFSRLVLQIRKILHVHIVYVKELEFISTFFSTHTSLKKRNLILINCYTKFSKNDFFNLLIFLLQAAYHSD